MYRSIIVEDEIASQELLGSIIKDYCQDIEIVGIASSRDEGVKMILSLKPDIVFMDIHLGDETSFEILDILPNRDFKLIITTAYTDYALTAFKYEAVDYLLKPYSPKEVIKAVDKVLKNVKNSSITWNNSNSQDHKIALNTHEGITFIDQANIISCCADGPYCMVISKNEGKILISKPLGDMESQLDKDLFVRVHASHLINLNHMKKFVKRDGGFLLMSDGSEIPVSRRKKQEFLDKASSNNF